jgi:hypothetical protein
VLDATLTATQTNDDVDLSYTVENPGEESVELSFSDAQRAEFVAERDDETVWRYGEGRMFGMVLGTLELPPSETASFEARWTSPEPGTYELRAWLVADDATAEAATTITVE